MYFTTPQLPMDTRIMTTKLKRNSVYQTVLMCSLNASILNSQISVCKLHKGKTFVTTTTTMLIITTVNTPILLFLYTPHAP